MFLQNFFNNFSVLKCGCERVLKEVHELVFE
jgi:hypothetical protein